MVWSSFQETVLWFPVSVCPLQRDVFLCIMLINKRDTEDSFQFVRVEKVPSVDVSLQLPSPSSATLLIDCNYSNNILIGMPVFGK